VYMDVLMSWSARMRVSDAAANRIIRGRMPLPRMFYSSEKSQIKPCRNEAGGADM
jgi:hypothetical protein